MGAGISTNITLRELLERVKELEELKIDTPVTQQIKKNINAILALEGEEKNSFYSVMYVIQEKVHKTWFNSKCYDSKTI
jgi:hypothetical protein